MNFYLPFFCIFLGGSGFKSHPWYFRFVRQDIRFQLNIFLNLKKESSVEVQGLAPKL